MTAENNQTQEAEINCEECGKINGDGPVGNHWICEDCNAEVPVKSDESN